MSVHCNNTDRSLQCHNSYQDSLYIGLYSHYTCPNTCVSVGEDMCQGVKWCWEDYEECGPHLRCHYQKHSLNSSLSPNHNYCGDGSRTSGEYDILDRSDETEAKSVEGTSYDIDTDLFPACNDKWKDPGVMCETRCLASRNWCDVLWITEMCYGVSMIDKRLCGNPLVFAGISCTAHSPIYGGIGVYGKRCTGTNQKCIVPWYTTHNGNPLPFPQICDDKSDQVFTTGLTCREHLQQYMQYHDEHFCKSEELDWLEDTLICTNKSLWLSEQDPSYSDPHNCQSSCSSPDPDCLACTNPDYFQCPQSDKCLHPGLVCDGHPQCPGGEDEDLDKCYKDYVKNHIIDTYALYRCTSLFYEKQEMKIFATPCNRIRECADNSDELTVKKVYSKSVPLPTQNLLIQYEKNLKDSETVQYVNLHLHHLSHNQNFGQKRAMLLMIYDLVEEQHNNNVCEIYGYLHNNFDPLLVQKMIASKYQGFGIKDFIKEKMKKGAKRLIITELINLTAKTKRIKEFIIAILNIEIKFLDIFKDLGLTILMLQLIGGLQAIIDLPTNFGSVVVLSMIASIFFPLFLSSLHLAVNNVDMLWTRTNNKYPDKITYLKKAFLFLLSPLHPLFLEIYYLEILGTMNESETQSVSREITGA